MTKAGPSEMEGGGGGGLRGNQQPQGPTGAYRAVQACWQAVGRAFPASIFVQQWGPGNPLEAQQPAPGLFPLLLPRGLQAASTSRTFAGQAGLWSYDSVARHATFKCIHRAGTCFAYLHRYLRQVAKTCCEQDPDVNSLQLPRACLGALFLYSLYFVDGHESVGVGGLSSLGLKILPSSRGFLFFSSFFTKIHRFNLLSTIGHGLKCWQSQGDEVASSVERATYE